MALVKKNPAVIIDGCFAHAASCQQAIDEAHQSKRESHLRISELTCPYVVGQVILTNSGLGLNGLWVYAVVPVVEARGPVASSNRWAIQTWALSKAGEVTKRAVYIDEGMKLQITMPT